MYDVVIIGLGPAGYVAAIRAGQLGMKCAVVERNKVGGMCLNWGCIPSKAMLESAKLYVKIANDADRFGIDGIDKKQVAFNWNKALKRAGTIVKKLTTGVSYLLKKNGVELISGNARMVSAHRVEVGDTSLDTKVIILATGSHAPELVTKHQGLVVDAASLFDEREWPNAIVVVGNNSVAVELAQLFNLIGKEVTLVVEGDSFLGQLDAYLSDYMLKQLKKDKVRVVFTDTLDLDKQWVDQQLKVGEEVIPCGVVINARSRIANKIESVEPLAYDDGFIRVNENLETSITDVYAIGDANGVSAFAHAASAQGLFVINRLHGVKKPFDVKKYPYNMYSYPEVSQLGSTEAELILKGVDYKISSFPLSANGKALIEGEAEGFVRVLSEKQYGEIMGVQIVAPNATDLINEAGAYMQLESTIYDMAQTIHAHPTISEVFVEAGFEAIDRAIHK